MSTALCVFYTIFRTKYTHILVCSHVKKLTELNIRYINKTEWFIFVHYTTILVAKIVPFNISLRSLLFQAHAIIYNQCLPAAQCVSLVHILVKVKLLARTS